MFVEHVIRRFVARITRGRAGANRRRSTRTIGSNGPDRRWRIVAFAGTQPVGAPWIAKARRRLRRSRRGVSPIIATILLVAITVTLAALFYVFLIPLIPHATTPLSGNFAWGTSTCYGAGCRPGPNTTGCQLNDFCWSVTISSASSGVAPASIVLYVQNATQQTVSTTGWTFYIIENTNPAQTVAYAPGSIAGSSGPGWTGGPNHSSGDALTLTDTLWIDTGSSHSFQGETLSLVTSGQNGFSGSLSGLILAT